MGNQTLAWTIDNRVASVSISGGGTTSMEYDYSGMRVKKIAPAGVTLYPFAGYEIDPNGVITKFIRAGGESIASKKGTAKYFYHNDHLGSVNVVTDATGVRVQLNEYDPWGAVSHASGTIDPDTRFTGQKLDPETGLYYYGGRYYDAEIGRFVSADPFVQTPYDPQNLNRYSYVTNSPQNYIDPEGYFHRQKKSGGFFSSFFGRIIGIVVGVVVGYFTGGAGFALAEAVGFGAEAATTIAGAIGAAAGAAANAAVTGGNIGQAALMGGVTGGFLGWLGYQSAIYNPAGASPFGASGGYGSAATAVYYTDACCIDFGNIAGVAGALGSTSGSIVRRSSSRDDAFSDGIITVSDHDTGRRFIAPNGVTIRNGHLAGKNHPITGIPFDSRGYPDFSSVSIKSVQINQTGNRAVDTLLANRAAGLEVQPRGFVWHHHQNGQTMQLVPERIHQFTGHTGGIGIK